MRKQIRKYKLLIYEICETLVTICLLLSEKPDPIGRNYRANLRSHASVLKNLSSFLIGRDEEHESNPHY